MKGPKQHAKDLFGSPAEEPKAPISTPESPESADFADIKWQAAEGLDYQHGARWHLLAWLIGIAIVALMTWLNWGEWLAIGSTALLVVVILISISVVNRQPSRQMKYEITPHGIKVNQQLHHWQEFRGWGIRHDGQFYMIVLLPIKRFGFETSAFVPDNQIEEIHDALSQVLPLEELNADWIGALTRKLKL
jgi:hypothetical protein